MRLSVAFIFISCFAYAQSDTTIHSDDSIRSIYIKRYPDHFFIWPVLKQRKLDFTISGKNANLQYNSNKPYSAGVGFYLFEIGFELTFATKLQEQNIAIYGKSETSDFQLSFIGRKWGGDAFIQKYEGYYIREKDILPGQPYPQRGDLQTRNMGLTINYNFRPNQFSFRSAYLFAERQLKSSGAFILFGGLSNFRCLGDSAIVGKSDAQLLGIAGNQKELAYTSLSIAPGYTYSMIVDGFFLNATLALGPSHNWIRSELIDAKTNHDIEFDTFAAFRIGVGYNGDRIFGGLTFYTQGRSTRVDDLKFSSSNNSFKILIGYRFREFGFLKHKARELPKQLGI